MLQKVVLAVVYAVAAFVICVVVGGILAALTVPIAVVIGNAFKEFAGLVSVLVFLYYLVAGGLPTLRS